MSAGPIKDPDDHEDRDGLPVLVQRIAAGHRAAEAEFVVRFQAGVRALVRRHCRPGDPAVDDLVQDVLANVLQKLREDAVRDEAALPGYLRSAVVFTVQAHYRKRARRGEDAAQAGDGPIEHEDPSRAAQRAALAEAVRRLVDELPVARDRELLRRFYLMEQERAEVCEVLDIEASHFHRVLFRARERLRLLLTEAGLGEEIP